MEMIKQIATLCLAYLRVAFLTLVGSAVVLAFVASWRDYPELAANILVLATVLILTWFSVARRHTVFASSHGYRLSAEVVPAVIGAASTVAAAFLGAALLRERRDEAALRTQLTNIQQQLERKTKEVERLRVVFHAKPRTSYKVSSDPPSSTRMEASTQHNLKVALERCQRSGATVMCDFSITSQRSPRRFMIIADPSRDNNSAAFGDAGVVWHAGFAVLGEVVGETPHTVLTPLVPIRATVRFEGVPNDVEKFIVLRLTVAVDGENDVVEFRTVSIAPV